jgi:hypothetical protein
VEYAVAAIVASIGALGFIAWLGWRRANVAQRLIGELLNENRSLREGVEARGRVDRVLAGPVASGGKLRARLLARAERELSESDSLGGASTSAGPDSGGD